MAANFPLSKGSLKVIMNGAQLDDPIMQVLGSKKIPSGSTAPDKERYRILLSDGEHLISFAMLSTHIDDKLVTGELPVNSIIKLKRYITSVINNSGKGDKRVLIILELELLMAGAEVGHKIGYPQPLPESDSATPASSNTFTATTAPMPRPNTASTTNLGSSLQDEIIFPISSLSPYQNKWVIKARINSKTNIRTWSNSRGEGKLFSMDLADESGEIRATAFKDAVDKYYDMLEVDKVYYISKCQLKVANKQYSSLKNDYEMTFTDDTIIQECHDDVSNIPMTQFNFVNIDTIAHIETGTLIDVIGVCKNFSEIVTFTAKTTGKELKKRDVTLVDQSSNSIDLTLWGSEAEKFDGTSQPVIAIKGAKVGEFGGGKSLSMFSSSLMKINPDMPQAHQLRGWFDNGGLAADSKNISARSGLGTFVTDWMDFKEAQDRGLGKSERGDYYQTVATVLYIKSENLVYKACPSEKCNKKLMDLENGMFRCEKCNREFPNFEYRLLLSINVGNSSGAQWLNLFTSEAEKVLKKTAQEIGEMYDSGTQEALTEAIENALFKTYLFKCRAKLETYNDEARLKTVAVKVEKVNHNDYNRYLCDKIAELTG